MLFYHEKNLSNFDHSLLSLQGWSGRILFSFSKRTILFKNVDKNKFSRLAAQRK